MGNQYAIKLKKIKNKNLLGDIVFGKDKKIVEFVYFITKINKFYAENFIKGSIIKEFTIFNILTKKEFNIVIERVESGLFFEDLDYSFEITPLKERVLFVSLVREGSLADLKNIIAGQTILLATNDKYLDSFNDVELEIINKNAKFIFYDFVKDIIIFVDFEELRTEDGKLLMGFECEEGSVTEISGRINKIKERVTNLINNNVVVDTIVNNTTNNLNNFTNNSIDKNTTIDLINPPEKEDYLNLNESNEDLNEKIQSPDTSFSGNLNFTDEEEIKTNINNTQNNYLIKENYPIEDKKENELIINTKIEINYNITDKLKELITSDNSITLNKNFKYKFNQSKKKYNKYLPIYSRIDANFNFINTEIKETKSINTENENNLNETSNNSIILNKNKKVILIKGFLLANNTNNENNPELTNLKINKVNENTIKIKL